MQHKDSSDFLKELIIKNKGVKFKNYNELATKAGINQGNLSNFLSDSSCNSRNTVTFETAWKILNFLGCSITESPMSEQITPRSITYYDCPVCKTGYTEEAEALRCSEREAEVDKQIENFQLWNWYRLESKSGRKVIILPYKVEKYKDARHKRCLGKWRMHIHDSQTPYYYTEKDWKIFEGPISIEEAWEKYRICPDFERTRKITDISVDVLHRLDCLRETVAEEIYQDIRSLRDDEKDSILFRLVEKTVMQGNVRPYLGIRETAFNPQINEAFAAE